MSGTSRVSRARVVQRSAMLVEMGDDVAIRIRVAVRARLILQEVPGWKRIPRSPAASKVAWNGSAFQRRRQTDRLGCLCAQSQPSSGNPARFRAVTHCDGWRRRWTCRRSSSSDWSREISSPRTCWRILKASWCCSRPTKRRCCGTTGAWTFQPVPRSCIWSLAQRVLSQNPRSTSISAAAERGSAGYQRGIGRAEIRRVPGRCLR